VSIGLSTTEKIYLEAEIDGDRTIPKVDYLLNHIQNVFTLVTLIWYAIALFILIQNVRSQHFSAYYKLIKFTTYISGIT